MTALVTVTAPGDQLARYAAAFLTTWGPNTRRTPGRIDPVTTPAKPADPIAWLRAQLDDDERAARAWLPLGNPTAADREHIARHDPARVLADVDAKRRILDLHVPKQSGYKYIDRDTRVPNMRCSVCHDVPDDVDYDNPPYAVEFPCPTVRLLALPHADRPGYQESWRP